MNHALTHRRNAVGELAADARRGRLAAGLGIVGGLAVLALCAAVAPADNAKQV